MRTTTHGRVNPQVIAVDTPREEGWHIFVGRRMTPNHRLVQETMIYKVESKFIDHKRGCEFVVRVRQSFWAPLSWFEGEWFKVEINEISNN